MLKSVPSGSRSLFTPVKIKDRVVKNRFMRSATAVAMADPEGFVTEDLCSFYREVAEGGVGLLITGAVSVHPRGKFFSRQLTAHTDAHIPGLERLAAAIHRHGDGVTVWPQLHCGAAQHWEPAGGQKGHHLEISRLQEDDIRTIVSAFGDAALRCQQAGFDGVQLHGAHRYLLSQFLSPATNSRKDAWGGTPEKRMCIVLNIYEDIREKTGGNFPIGIKMNTADYLEGGNAVQDTARYAKRFAETGFDLIEMSGGMANLTELRDELRKRAGQKEAYFRDAVPEFRRAAGSTALALCGGIRTPQVMQEILGEGVDFISLSRPLLAEPDLPNRIREGDYGGSRCASAASLCDYCREKVAKGFVKCIRR